MSRFERQIILPGFGKTGQKRLLSARVLVVGAGGLGCPALLHLAAAGVGTLGIADGDSISESNLNRQTLFGTGDVGKPKAKTAALILKEKYPDVHFQVISDYLSSGNALDMISEYDLVLDGSDNFGTRYMINDACTLLNKPLVMGAIYQYEGQVMVLNHGKEPINYRDLYPDPPGTHEIPNCSETGVLGVLPGVVGTLQAAEALKIISKIGEVLSNKILFYNLKSGGFYEVAVTPNPGITKRIPKDREDFQARDYHISCGQSQTVSWKKAMDWAENFESSILVDIREQGELPEFERKGISRIPMSVLKEDPEKLHRFEHILLFCRSGGRSVHLAQHLKQRYPEKKIFSVAGGILSPDSPLNSDEK